MSIRYTLIVSFLATGLLVTGLLVTGSLAVAGCGGGSQVNTMGPHVSVAAAPFMGCPPGQLASAHLGSSQWQVQGCGMVATFLCARGRGGGRRWRRRRGGGGMQCRVTVPARPIGGQMGGQMVAGGQAPPPGYAQGQVNVQVQTPQPTQVTVTASARAWTPELGQEIFARLSGPVLACVPGSTPLSLSIEFTTNGTVARIGGVETLPPAQQSCLTAAMQAAVVQGGLTQAVRVPFNFR